MTAINVRRVKLEDPSVLRSFKSATEVILTNVPEVDRQMIEEIFVDHKRIEEQRIGDGWEYKVVL